VLVELHIDLALSIADRAIVLHHGRTALAGPAADLRARRPTVAEAYFGGRVTR
jgi:branched-chain amino acid transport system ATP-binding protein